MIRKPYVFICYTSDGIEAVQELEKTLREYQISLWDYKDEMVPGDSTYEKFMDALYAADLFVPVITPNFCNPGSATHLELEGALDRQSELRQLARTNDLAFIIPLLTSKSVDVPLRLKGIVYARTGEAVLRAIQVHMEKFMLKDNPYSFSNWPRPIVDQGMIDAMIVVGHSGKESEPSDNQIADLIPNYDPFTKCRYQSQRIAEYLPYLVIHLHSAANLVRSQKGLPPSTETDETFQCHVDWHAIKFHSDRLRSNNIISLGAGDTNLISRWILSVYHQHLPIRFDSPAGSQTLFCDATGKLDATMIDSVKTDMHRYGALLLIVPNPLNNEKVAVVAAGLNALGTQAAMLALAKNSDQLRTDGVYHGNYARILIGVEKDWRAVSYRFLR